MCISPSSLTNGTQCSLDVMKIVAEGGVFVRSEITLHIPRFPHGPLMISSGESPEGSAKFTGSLYT